MRAFAVSALGRERPGILAGVTEVLADFALSIDAAHADVLRGHFACTFVVRGGDHVEAEEIERALEPVRERLGLAATAVCELGFEGATALPLAPTCQVTVDCAERPGLAHAVCSTIANAGATIISLAGTDGQLSLAVRTEGDDGPLRARLGELARTAQAEVSVAPVSLRAA